MRQLAGQFYHKRVENNHFRQDEKKKTLIHQNSQNFQSLSPLKRPQTLQKQESRIEQSPRKSSQLPPSSSLRRLQSKQIEQDLSPRKIDQFESSMKKSQNSPFKKDNSSLRRTSQYLEQITSSQKLERRQSKYINSATLILQRFAETEEQTNRTLMNAAKTLQFINNEMNNLHKTTDSIDKLYESFKDVHNTLNDHLDNNYNQQQQEVVIEQDENQEEEEQQQQKQQQQKIENKKRSVTNHEQPIITPPKLSNYHLATLSYLSKCTETVPHVSVKALMQKTYSELKKQKESITNDLYFQHHQHENMAKTHRPFYNASHINHNPLRGDFEQFQPKQQNQLTMRQRGVGSAHTFQQKINYNNEARRTINSVKYQPRPKTTVPDLKKKAFAESNISVEKVVKKQPKQTHWMFSSKRKKAFFIPQNF